MSDEQITDTDVTPDAQKQTPDRGFPADTPIAEMTTEEQLAYFKFHDRKKGDTLKAFDGMTPDEAKSLRDRVAAAEREKMTADERAIAEAREQAATEARTATAAELSKSYGNDILEAVSGVLLDADQQRSFLAIASPDKFTGEDGRFDVQGLMGHLTAIYGTKERQFGSGLPQHKNWGQNNGQPPAKTPGEQGRAEAAKRFGTQT